MKMKQTVSILLGSLLAAALVTGCNPRTPLKQQSVNTPQPIQYGQNTQTVYPQGQSSNLTDRNTAPYNTQVSPGQPGAPGTMNNRTKDQMVVAQKAADQLATLTAVRNANVIVTGNTAYVAATLMPRIQMSQAVENQIAQKVKTVDPTIQHVYVSTNPDFVNRMKTYAEDINQGRPVSGLINQFNEMVNRVFPSAH